MREHLHAPWSRNAAAQGTAVWGSQPPPNGKVEARQLSSTGCRKE
ncbi:hypothetical protein [Paenibacillus glycanilyticus]|nr:hypothetical protein [Paenibacillus glycanilyticus]